MSMWIQLGDSYGRFLVCCNKSLPYCVQDKTQPLRKIHGMAERESEVVEEGGGEMKNGKNPTMKQKQRLKKLKLNPENWMIVKNCPNCFEIVHRISGKTRILGA
ncbi:hypothetical protein E4K67_22630 [Desulfosporosinus fructosivorans]|uniref:DUF6906 domain-containing protein n=2 Tax=Desulfosporosinus fructosivorans TaxID=2018669 RepID=A0A4Z0R0P2_9FIRM|nr:hypothetical protein E4K67_22630 [Desulfosporosinus fructosivorans]